MPLLAPDNVIKRTINRFKENFEQVKTRKLHRQHLSRIYFAPQALCRTVLHYEYGTAGDNHSLIPHLARQIKL